MGSMYLDADDILVISKVYNLILRCKRSQDKGDVILSFFYKVKTSLTQTVWPLSYYAYINMYCSVSQQLLFILLSFHLFIILITEYDKKQKIIK